MANAIYDKYKEALLSGAANSSLTTETVKVSLIDANTAAEPFIATDQFYDDVTTANSVLATVTLSNVTVTNGVLDADDVSFTSVSDTSTDGDADALLFWIDTGNTATSRLVAWMDTNIDGLPITPDGSDVDVTWAVDGIFKL